MVLIDHSDISQCCSRFSYLTSVGISIHLSDCRTWKWGRWSACNSEESRWKNSEAGSAATKRSVFYFRLWSRTAC